ncbi:MAG: putative dsRNA-binding protein, partial [Sporomusaceae bacterium]|nr:putative dsRNA-binding protein [Sporomusaceae bacterium]
YLLLGKGEALSGGRERISILADTFEAVIGAVYLELGFPAAAEMILRLLEKELSLIEIGDYVKDFKTWLQEVAQRSPDNKVVYEVVEQSGPDHDKVFTIRVCLNDREMGIGVGKSKKEAEQRAAKAALRELHVITDETA